MKLVQLLGSVACLTLAVFNIGCSSETVTFKKEVVSYLGNADLVVVNKTTGESIQNTGIDISAEHKRLEVRSGDVLEMTYTPQEEYAEYNYTVTFNILNIAEEKLSSKPYIVEYSVGDIPAGDYYISCEGFVDTPSVCVKDSGSVGVRVVM